MAFRETLIAACTDKAKTLGRKLLSMEVVELACECHAKATKEKKRAGIDERAQAIFNVYPRREGGSAALVSITKAIQQDGFEAVLSKTTEYAAAVARWPRLYRYSQSKPGEPARDLVPMATTWFNQNRYLDDAANWVRVGGASAPKPKAQLNEPAGWRSAFPDFLHVTRDWPDIDEASQSYIVAEMEKRRHTA